MKAEVVREKLKAKLKLARKVSGGIGDHGRLAFLVVGDGTLEISTFNQGIQWLTVRIDLESGEDGTATVELEELLKIVERLETDNVKISTVGSKLKVQGGRRQGTLPKLNLLFPAVGDADGLVDVYDGENTFKNAIRKLISISLDVATQWGCIRVGGDGFAGSSDTGNLFWTKLQLIEGQEREILIPAGNLSVLSDLSGRIIARLSDNLLIVKNDECTYRCALSSYSVPPYATIVNQRVQGERVPFHSGLIVSEMEDFAKVSKEAAQVIIKDGSLTVKSLPTSTTEFETQKDWDGDLTCRFFTKTSHFINVAKLLPDTCELIIGGTSHVVMTAEDDVAIVSCLDGSLSFEP